MAKTPPRQLILEAVAVCIEKYGIDKLTTRKIAEEAGTNVASINYYFRSKDELIAEVMAMTVNHMVEDILAIINDADRSFETILQETFFYLIDGAKRFPGISTAHLYDGVVNKRYDSPGGKAFRKVFDALCERACQEFPRKDPEKVRFLLAQVISSLMFTMLSPGFFPVAKKYQPSDPERCRALAETLAATFFAAL